jgi:nicotinate-nucleotide pyrophosphorylase (carboxylating)
MAGGLENAISRVQAHLAHIGKDLRIEVEVRDFRELDKALSIGASTASCWTISRLEDLKVGCWSDSGAMRPSHLVASREANLREHALTG